MLRTLLAFTFLAGCLSAQNGIAELADEALFDQTEVWELAVETMHRKVENLRQQSLAVRVEIGELRLRLRALSAPAQGVVADSAFVWERTARELAWQRQRLALTAQRITVLEDLARLTAANDSLLVRQVSEGRLLDLSIEELTPYVSALQARFPNGAGVPAQLQYTTLAALGALRKGATALVSAWQETLEGMPGRLESLRRDLGQARSDRETQQQELREAEARDQDARQRRDFYETLTSQGRSKLASGFAKDLEQWRERGVALERRVQPFSKIDSRLVELDARVASLHPPRREDIVVEHELLTVRNARLDLALARQERIYLESLGVLLMAREDEVEANILFLQGLKPALESFWVDTLHLDVTREALLKAGLQADSAAANAPSADALQAELERLQALRQSTQQRLDTRQAQAIAVKERRTRNQAEIAGVDSDLPRLVQAVERAEAKARWTGELPNMSDEALLATFAAAEDSLGLGLGRVAEVKRSLEAAAQQVSSIERRLERAVDPLLRQVQLREQDQRGAILAALEAGKSLPVLQSTAVRAANPEGNSFELEAWIASLETARSALLARRGAFQERVELEGALSVALSEELSAVRELEQARMAALESSQRYQGAGIVIQSRYDEGRLPASSLPAQLVAAQRGDEAIALSQSLEQLAARRSLLDGRLFQVQTQKTADANLERSLIQRLELLTRKLVNLRALKALDDAFAGAAEASLSELALKQRDEKILADIMRDNTWTESFLLLFASERASDLSEILRGYYEAVVEVKRKRQNLSERQLLVSTLVQLLRDEQRLLTSLQPQLQSEQGRLELLDQVVSQHAAAALSNPTERERIIESLRKQLEAAPDELARRVLGGTRVPDPVADNARGAGIEKWTSRIFEVRCAVQANRAWLEEVQASAGREGRLGRLDEAVAELDELQARLEAQDSEQLQVLAGLRGEPGPAPAGAALSADELERRRLGNIGWTRSRRLEELTWEAQKTSIWIFLLPLVAFVLIRLAGVLGRNFVARIQRGPTPEDDYAAAMARKEREDRARTLVNVFRAAWTILVVLLSGIYFLKAVRIDVTPIVASAGILGLAVAFGMQPLMRDWFAGFFILLENQYKLGDMITLAGQTGVVDRITLRLTIIRDPLGVLHFIPNGHVDMVSNLTKEYSQANLVVGVSYNTRPEDAISSLKRVGDVLKAERVVARNILEYTVLGIDEFADSSVNIRVAIKVRPGTQISIARYARKKIFEVFAEDGIEIPFPQRVIHQANPQEE